MVTAASLHCPVTYTAGSGNVLVTGTAQNDYHSSQNTHPHTSSHQTLLIPHTLHTANAGLSQSAAGNLLSILSIILSKA